MKIVDFRSDVEHFLAKWKHLKDAGMNYTYEDCIEDLEMRTERSMLVVKALQQIQTAGYAPMWAKEALKLYE